MQVKFLFPSITLMLLLSSFIQSCNQPRNRIDEENDFYTNTGSISDYNRVPLIRPYELIKTPRAGDWKVKLYLYTVDLTINNVLEVNVIHDVIIVHSGETYFRDIKKLEAWFVIIPSQNVEKGYDNRKEFMSYLSELGIKEVILFNADKVFEEFNSNKKINWKNGFE